MASAHIQLHTPTGQLYREVLKVFAHLISQLDCHRAHGPNPSILVSRIPLCCCMQTESHALLAEISRIKQIKAHKMHLSDIF